MKKIIFVFIIIILGCSDDMDGSLSQMTSDILNDDNTTLRQKLESLDGEKDLWFSQNQYEYFIDELEIELKTYNRFFQDGNVANSFSHRIYRDCWYPYQSSGSDIDEIIIQDENAYFISYEYDGVVFEFALDGNELFSRRYFDSEEENTEWVYRLVTENQYDEFIQFQTDNVQCDLDL